MLVSNDRCLFTRHILFDGHLAVYRSTQLCIPPGSLNQVPASPRFKAGKSSLPGGRVTLCDPIRHAIFCSSVVISTNCYICFIFTFTLSSSNSHVKTEQYMFRDMPTVDNAKAV